MSDESVVREFEQQQVGTIKLSEAIRIGAKLRPRGDGYLFRDGLSCALGAAWEGLGMPYMEWPADAASPERREYSRIYDELERMFPRASMALIFERNDMGLSRESIADWLESHGF